MDKARLIASIESGRQLGVRKYMDIGGAEIGYTYAVQKLNGRYIVFVDEYNVDRYCENELEDTEKVTVYDTIDEFFDNFITKYDVSPEDFCKSKGGKYFNADLYRHLT